MGLSLLPTRKKTLKKKTVHYELLAPDVAPGAPIYARVNAIVQHHHSDLEPARIAIAWCTSWKPDVDGNLVLGKLKKASDLEREFAAFDFVILLNRWFWQHRDTTDDIREAILDHELCHAAPALDDKGAQKIDERDRLVWRVRKHDIEEFVEVVERHGVYRHQIEAFAKALRVTGLAPWQPCEACRQSPGYRWVIDADLPTLQRCACWTAYQEQRKELAS